MAIIQVILNGIPSGQSHDAGPEPVTLQFDEDGSADNAFWVIPNFPGDVPAYMLSEIRVEQGPFFVRIDGPEGFQSGPYETNWVRCDYPRGKFCSLLMMHAETRSLSGVTVEVDENGLQLGEVKLGGT